MTRKIFISSAEATRPGQKRLVTLCPRSAIGISVARQTVERCAEKVSRLCEQGAAVSRIGTYLQRWGRAVLAGMWVELEFSSMIEMCDYKT